MKLIGYYMLSPNCPSFVLPIFAEITGKEKFSELYIQKIDYPTNKIVGFEVLQNCEFTPYNSDQIVIKNVNDFPLYAAQLSETEIFIGVTEEFKGRMDSLDANCFPNEFKIQLYNLVGESGLEKNARRNFVKNLDQARGREHSESYIQTSVSMSGWEKTEEMLMDSGLRKIFLENFSDIRFSISKQRIIVENTTTIKELEALDLSDVIESLESEYLDILNLVGGVESTNSYVDNTLETSISQLDKFDFEFFPKFVRSFGRQEERLSIVLLSCLVFPNRISEIFRYRDYAKTAIHGLNCLKENYKRFSAHGHEFELEEVVKKTIIDIYLDWQSGDRIYLAGYLTKWFYPYQDFYQILTGHTNFENLRYQEYRTRQLEDEELEKLVDLPAAMDMYMNQGVSFVYQYRSVDWRLFV